MSLDSSCDVIVGNSFSYKLECAIADEQSGRVDHGTTEQAMAVTAVSHARCEDGCPARPALNWNAAAQPDGVR